MSYKKIRAEIEALSKEKFKLVAHAKARGCETTSREDVLIAEFDGAIDALKEELQGPETPLTMPANGPLGVPNQGGGIRKDGGAGLIGPNERKDYKALFGNGGYDWPDKDTNFFAAALSGRHHPGLIQNSMSETIPSDGGFLVPAEQAARIHAVSLENELVMPRCYVQPMRSNTIKIPAMSIGDHSTALFGGFTASYTAEEGTISEANPKSRAMELNAGALYCTYGLLEFLNFVSQFGQPLPLLFRRCFQSHKQSDTAAFRRQANQRRVIGY